MNKILEATEQSLFTKALCLSDPWEVISVEFDPDQGRIDFELGFRRGSKFACCDCGADAQPIHDTRRRTWRHLNFFQYQAYLHASVPRTVCADCGKVKQVLLPWARPGSHFTLLFESFSLALCKKLPVNTAAQELAIGDDPLWRILHHYVNQARAKEDFNQVRQVGIDETAARRGHNYVTFVHDLKNRRLLYGCEGRNQATVESFAKDLKAHAGDPAQITDASIDMSKAYIAGVSKHLPNAQVTFDRFHIIQLANQAMDEVRRQETKDEPLLRRTRWLWLKDKSKWTTPQATLFKSLPNARLKTTRAWRLKESLRELFQSATNSEEAGILLNSWHSWARRSRLEPFKQLANTLKNHRPGILKGFDSMLSNGYVEGFNSLVQAAKAKARGYRKSKNMITIAYLLGAKLAHLPASPFATRCTVQLV
uniref:Transposase n=3 Tax=Candidatus Kentrum sp. MB TaxID=2138164 RepID=A0A451B883_9GAMM|nr:MAG: Transposase [Candidatus Kentron sp. MB]